jgi:hypothetical protein
VVRKEIPRRILVGGTKFVVFVSHVASIVSQNLASVTTRTTNRFIISELVSARSKY